MRRLLRFGLATFIALLFMAAGLLIPAVRAEVRALVRSESPAVITPIALVLPQTMPAHTPLALPSATTSVREPLATATATPVRDMVAAAPTRTRSPLRASATPVRNSRPARPRPSTTPDPSPTRGRVVVNGRTYDAYIPAASKKAQAYQYSCEFDAAWVILQTYGIDVTVDQLIATVGVDRSVEPYIEETAQGFVIHGGDITTAFSGDYKKNFLARSSAPAMRKAFTKYGLRATIVRNRAGVEAALRSGKLVWIKTTVDFKPWRPATWRMPDGRTQRTVLGNDHAVVVIGFNARSVVIRDVLGPTSSNRKRPYEYEVDWATFLASWEAQSFDGLAVAPRSAR